MTERYHVRVTKDYLVFSAAHFITIGEDLCERLHGHNYRVAAEVEGPLDENFYVIDFIALREVLREITAELDHHVLLPTKSRLIAVRETGAEVEARYRERRWVFPREDCVLLPVENTTAERLAWWLGRRVQQALHVRLGRVPGVVRIEVDECYGQVGVCQLRVEG